MEHRQKEWREHETHVMHLLENPHLLPEQKSLGNRQLMLHLWHYPAFAPFTIWLVYRGEGYLLREVVWDRQTDASRILAPLEGLKHGFRTAPSFRIRTVELADAHAEGHIAALERISLPVFIQRNAVSLDGETFGIAVGTGNRVVWRGNAPWEWHEVESWFQQAKEYFEAELAINFGVSVTNSK